MKLQNAEKSTKIEQFQSIVNTDHIDALKHYEVDRRTWLHVPLIHKYVRWLKQYIKLKKETSTKMYTQFSIGFN